MSDAAVKTRIEIFRGTLAVHCGDVDNWEGWTASLGAWSRAGDFAALFIDLGEFIADVEKAVSFNTALSPYCVVRATYLDGTHWRIFIKRADTHTWVQAGEYNSAGIKRINLASAYSGLIEAIELEVQGSQYQQCEFDYLIVSDKQDLEITDTSLELIDCVIHLGQTNEVDDFELLLDNSDHKFTVTSPVSEGEHIKIYGCREGQVGAYYPMKLFCGRIETTSLEINAREKVNKLRPSGRSYGEQLFRQDVNATFGAKNYEVRDDAEDSHSLDTFQLVGTCVFSPVATQRVHVQLCTLQVYVTSGNAYFKLTSRKEGGSETTIATDLKFTATSYEPKKVACEVLGDVGNDVTIKFYTRVEAAGAATVYSKENRAVGDYLLEVSEIVKSVIDNYTTLKHAAGETELVETTDTYLTADYADVKVFDVLSDLAKKADKSGAMGYVFRTRWDGLFQWFPKNSKTSPISITDLIEDVKFKKSIARIRNDFTVLGNPSCSIPYSEDWCDALTDWSADIGSISLVTTANAKVGTGYIEGSSTDVNPMQLRFKKVFSRLKALPASLPFWAGPINPGNCNCKVVRLLAPDANNYFEAVISSDLYVWTKNDIALGHANEYDPLNNVDGKWFRVGSPSWAQVSAALFYLTFYGTEQHYYWPVDGLFFSGARFYYMDSDTASQLAHGLRVLSPETDDELYSYTECQLRVKALKAYYKDSEKSAVVRTSLIAQTYADRLLAADKIEVVLPDDNVDEWMQIISIEYVLGKEQEFETVLTLGVEPVQGADYIYALQRKVTAQARTKATSSGGSVG